MENGLLHLHNFMRWIVLLFMILTLVRSLSGMSGNRPFTAGNRKTALFMMISADIQLLLGVSLYIMRGWWGALSSGGAAVMKEPATRFWAVEHLAGMLIGIVLIHVAYSAAKKDLPDVTKFKRLFIFTLLALIVILVTIPWPFRELIGRPWFPGMSS
jgi:hypothetical protein